MSRKPIMRLRPKVRFAFVGMFVLIGWFLGTAAAEQMGRYGVVPMVYAAALVSGFLLVMSIYLLTIEVRLFEDRVESIGWYGKRTIAIQDISDIATNHPSAGFGVPEERMLIQAAGGRTIRLDSGMSSYYAFKVALEDSWKSLTPQPPLPEGEGEM